MKLIVHTLNSLNTIITCLLICTLWQGNAQFSFDELSQDLELASNQRMETDSIPFPYATELAKRFSIDTLILITEQLPNSKAKAYATSYLLNIEIQKTRTAPTAWVDYLLNASERFRDPKLLFHVFRSLGIYYERRDKPSEAIFYFDRSNVEAQKTSNPEWQVVNSTSLIRIYRLKKNYEKAFEYAYKNLSVRKQMPLDFNLPYAYYILGQLYHDIGNTNEAFEELSEAQALFAEIDQEAFVARVLLEKSNFLSSLNLPDSALILATQALDTYKNLNSNRNLGQANQQLGKIYLNKNQGALALQHFQNADSLLQGTLYHLNVYAHLGDAHLTLKNYDLAEDYYIRFLDTAMNQDYQKLIPSANTYLAKLYLQKKDYEAAKLYAYRAKEEAIKRDFDFKLNQLNQYICEAHFNLSEYDEAYAIQRENRDIITKEQQALRSQNANALKLKYQLQSQREFLQTEKQIAVNEKKWSSRINWILASSFVIICFLLYRNVNRNNVLASKNQEIKTLNENLESKVKERTQALELNQQELALVLNNTQDFMGSLSLNDNGEIIIDSFNSTALDYLKNNRIIRKDQEVIGKSYVDYAQNTLGYSEELTKERLGYIYTALSSKRKVIYDAIHDNVEKKRKTFYEVTLNPVILNNEQHCSRIIFSMHNITERENARRALLKSEKKLSTIYNASLDYIGLLNYEPNGEIILESFNAPAKKYLMDLGTISSLNELEGIRMSALFKDVYQLEQEAVDYRMKNIRTVFTDQEIFVYQSLFSPRGTDQISYYETSISPIVNPEGKCTQALYVAKDITESKVANKKIIESEKRLSMVFNGAKDQMFIFDVKKDFSLVFEDANQAYKNTWSYVLPDKNINDAIGLDATFFLQHIMGLPQKEAEGRIKLMQEIIKQKKPRNYEESFFSKARNKEFMMEITATPIFSNIGICEKLFFVVRDVTRKVAAQKALAENEKQLTTIYNSSYDLIGLIQKSVKGKYFIKSINEPGINFLLQIGRIKEPEELIGIEMGVLFNTVFGLTDVETKDRMEMINQVFAQQKIIKHSNPFAPRGTDIHMNFETTISPIVDELGQCNQALYSARDITESEVAKRKVIASEKRLASIYNASQDMIGLMRIDPDGHHIVESFNQPAINLLTKIGLIKPLDHSGNKNLLTVLDFFKGLGLSSAQIDNRMQRLNNVANDNKSLTYDHIFDSETVNIQKHLEITLSPILDNKDICTHILFSARDVTKQKQAELELRASEAHAKTLFEHSPILIWEEDFSAVKAYFEALPKKDFQDIRTYLDNNPEEVKHLGGLIKVIDVNQKSIDFYNMGSKQNHILDFDSYFVESSWEVLKEELIALAEGSSAFESEIEIKNKEGKVLQLIINLTIPPEYKGTWESVIVSFVDITEREATKRKLLINERRLSSIFNSTADQMAVVDITPDGQLILESINKAFKEAWEKVGIGINIESLYKLNVVPLIKQIMSLSSDYVDMKLEKVLNIVKEKRTINFEEVYNTLNGKKYLLDITVSPILNKEEICTKLIFVIRDITMKHRAKEKMISKILETEDRERSRFAKELHDSLGQNLTAASINFNYAKKGLSRLPEDFRRKFESGVKFLTEAIQESRNIAHNLMPQSITDFGYILTIESLLENLNGSSSVQFDFYDNLKDQRLPLDLELSLYRITQEAINNILKHAEATQVSIQLIKHQDSVILTIEDNGKGFNKPHKISSFGLNSMKNRVSAHSGTLDIEGAPGKGTSITLEIPVDFVY